MSEVEKELERLEKESMEIIKDVYNGLIKDKEAQEQIELFHEDNFEDTKIIFFDDVNLPNIKKLSLYGSDLRDTSLYVEHLKHGKIWYIVLKSKRHGSVVGVTRSGVVTIFSKATRDDFLGYVKEGDY
jgi:hypothetical protein